MKLAGKLFLCFCLIGSILHTSAQNNVCSLSTRFCTDSSFDFPAPVAGITAEIGPDYGCLANQPNPTWYYLQITDTGTIILNIAGADVLLDDVDFACWGPFTTPTAPCSGGLTSNCSGSFFGCEDNTTLTFMSYPSGNLVDCSYDAQSTETCTIKGLVMGNYYIIMVTNFGGNVTNIILTQTNAGQIGAGSADCGIGNVGLKSVSKKKEFTLYPNPNTGKFTVSLGDMNNEVNLRITNLLGENIHERKLFTSITEMDLDLISGMYLITLEGEITNLQYKLIVE